MYRKKYIENFKDEKDTSILKNWKIDIIFYKLSMKKEREGMKEEEGKDEERKRENDIVDRVIWYSW